MQTTHMIAGATAVLLAACSASAAIQSFSWSGDTSFNQFTVNVPAFEAAQFVGLTSQSGTYRAWWAGATDFTFDIRLEGVWTTVWSSTITQANGTLRIEDAVAAQGPVGFDSGTIDGFRFTSSNVQSQALRQFNALNSGSGTVFFFDTDPIPTPGSAALVGVALIAASRRRRAR